MNYKINDGGPAFPCEQGHTPDGGWNQSFDPGMTLRDYFAAKAMAGSLAGEPGPHLVPHTLARESYAMADAMLEARQA